VSATGCDLNAGWLSRSIHTLSLSCVSLHRHLKTAEPQHDGLYSIFINLLRIQQSDWSIAMPCQYFTPYQKLTDPARKDHGQLGQYSATAKEVQNQSGTPIPFFSNSFLYSSIAAGFWVQIYLLHPLLLNARFIAPIVVNGLWPCEIFPPWVQFNSRECNNYLVQ
jgi:hypothetical protein